MHIGPEFNDGTITINAYDSKSITIGDNKYHETLLILSGEVYPNWTKQTPETLTENHLSQIIKATPQVFIIGTGDSQVFLSHQLITLFHQHHIGIETMNTGSACRTFNLLAAEGRNVAGLFFLNNP